MGVSTTGDEGVGLFVPLLSPGTLITGSTSSSNTDVVNPTTIAEIAATITTIACDYASQPVYVDMTVHTRWKNASDLDVMYQHPYINGAARGLLHSMGTSVTSESSGDGVDVSGASSGKTGNVTFNSGGPSTGTHHTHTAGTYDFASHTHDSGSYSVNGNHTHDYRLSDLTMTSRIVIQTTADGSGDIKLGIGGYSSGGGADIESWQIAYMIWRR